MIELRPYQLAALDRVRHAFADGAQAVCLQAPTGAGKTIIMCAVADGAVNRGRRVLFVAHQDILIRQMSNKLRQNDLRHGVIMAGFTPQPHLPVQVASVQTLVRRVKTFRYQFDLIMIDESHRAPAASYRAVLDAIPGARVLGVTGTPCRLDGMGLGRSVGGIFDVLIKTESVKELIAMGYLVRPVYYASRDKLDLSGVKMKAGDYDETALADVVDTPVITGSAVAHYQKHVPGLPALTWCINIAHAEHTAAQFNAAGIRSIVLSGKSSPEERERGLAQLARREVLNVCFAQLLVEGVDVPAVRALIMLRPTQSLTAYLQVCGRGLRPDPDDPSKRSCIILDHAGLALNPNLGLCDEDREWSLEGRKKKKKKPTDKLDTMQCEQCFLVFKKTDLVDGLRCPGCGAEVVKERSGPEHVDGELEEITADMAARLRFARQREVKSARTLEELKAIGKQRDYSPRWAEIQWELKRKAQARAQERAVERWGLDYQVEP